MPWSHITGQHRASAMLQLSLVQRRIPQALLLIGDDGAGTVALALELARTLLCEAPHITERTYDRCGDCRSCRQSAQLQHPNLQFVLPLPAGKATSEGELTSALVEEWRDVMSEVAIDPYVPLRLQQASAIRIGQIRELKRMLAMSSAAGGRRVVILHHADDMNTEAANAFLKTLEEPHPDVTLLLTCERPEVLLPTIRSRCQELIIPPIADEDLTRYLIESESLAEQEARLVTAFAQGSLYRARRMAQEEVSDERRLALELLRTALRGKDYRIDLVTLVDHICEGKQRDRVANVLSLLSVWLRDARCVAVSEHHATLVNSDQYDALLRFSQGFGQADFDQALSVLEEAAADIHRNVALPLLLLSCALQLRRVFAAARQGSPAPSSHPVAV